MATKKVTDEQILAALRKRGTIMRAARALGIAHQTLRERLSHDPLKTSWRKMRAADVDLDLAGFIHDVKAARRKLKALMKHGGAQDNIQFAAACRIVDTAMKLKEADEAASQDVHRDWEIPEFPVQRGTTTTTAEVRDPSSP
jgi:hypothetical protein